MMKDNFRFATLVWGSVVALVVGSLIWSSTIETAMYYSNNYCYHSIVVPGASGGTSSWTKYSKPPKCGAEAVPFGAR